MEAKKQNRHKWVKEDNGKKCLKCGSRINSRSGLPKYMEVDTWGVSEYTNWYPRCFPIQKL